ncbi:methyltransferase [Maliponia aquimaris]|uniref:Malonyl-[acyl-carrier protein] O-methyltransferase n=1 Tax=Maliponia aquimaris TaxID=1673631 RepID=A0A238KND9_9RHOB|nr:methyltransferase [Maliponia aquimaris]SMX43682.1 Malonyl-[acyl-carrier protein] O-methyltransferase [Maliponia aquimaris]
MQVLHFSSGSPQADRRAQFAETLSQLGDTTGAAEALASALDLVPRWAAGWFRLGEYHEAAGNPEAAARAFGRAVEADPADPLGAGIRRDLLTGTPLSESLPAAFVELLFDQYAPRFDSALMGRLGYQGPQILCDTLDRAGIARVGHALDLGCGTGLTGAVLRPRCDRLTGIDISARMLAEARAKGIYDHLDKADIGTLEIGPRYDLIAANDVFNYLGALERVISWCAGSLAPDGALVFTVEQGDRGVALHETRRFRHARRYVTDLLAEAGFARVEVTPCVLRHDGGAPIRALAVTAQELTPRTTRQSDGESEIAA